MRIRIPGPSSGMSSRYNVVQVVARRTGDDSSAPDGQFPLAFGWAVGRSQVPIQTSATAFIEARDLVVVLDFSASMNDDSSLKSGLGQTRGGRRAGCDVGCLSRCQPAVSRHQHVEVSIRRLWQTSIPTTAPTFRVAIPVRFAINWG